MVRLRAQGFSSFLKRKPRQRISNGAPKKRAKPMEVLFAYFFFQAYIVRLRAQGFSSFFEKKLWQKTSDGAAKNRRSLWKFFLPAFSFNECPVRLRAQGFPAFLEESLGKEFQAALPKTGEADGSSFCLLFLSRTDSAPAGAGLSGFLKRKPRQRISNGAPKKRAKPIKVLFACFFFQAYTVRLRAQGFSSFFEKKLWQKTSDGAAKNGRSRWKFFLPTFSFKKKYGQRAAFRASTMSVCSQGRSISVRPK